MTSTEMIYLALFIICLLLSAFFSSAETAFTALQRVKVEHMVSTGVPGAKRIARMMRHPEKLLSTILTGNNLVNTAAAALGTVLAISVWETWGILIATIGVSVILLIFCESTPKLIAVHNAERMSIKLAKPVEAASRLFAPAVLALSAIASRFSKLAGGEPVVRSLVSAEEIRTMISVGHKEGTVEEAEAEMLHKVFDFGDRPVREVTVPRTEVIWIEKGTKIADFFTVYAESPLSRFPVYEESLDNVVGILSVKDVLMGLAKGTITNDSTIDDLIRPAYFAPETKRIGELFAEMQEQNYRMAVVVDEYGGTAGIVSLSRLVEEIIGPVGDELAEADRDYEAINEYTFHVDGSMRVEEANEEMGLELPEGEDYETVAGFILSLLGRIPKQGKQLRYKGLKIVVTKMRGLKIEEVLIIKEKKTEHVPPEG
ncbi:MAG: HlyC/CorC family transporter [Dehalococcoidales bacterium]|nr:HlyC/CorC family transporter [Dehalococcoidales bacterium]